MKKFLAALTAALVLTACTAAPARAVDPTPKKCVVDDDLGGSSTAGIFTSAITTLRTSSTTVARSSALRITIGLTGSDSVLNLLVIYNGKTIVIPLNSGNALTSSTGLHTFVVGVTDGMVSDVPLKVAVTYNLSLTSATRVGFLLVEECQSDDL